MAFQWHLWLARDATKMKMCELITDLRPHSNLPWLVGGGPNKITIVKRRVDLQKQKPLLTASETPLLTMGCMISATLATTTLGPNIKGMAQLLKKDWIIFVRTRISLLLSRMPK